MADPYKTLGVSKTATEEEIRKAYRKLAKENHPDLNPGDAAAETRFKEISAANALLGDPEKRRAYDAGEIDETGAPQAERRFYREYASADPGGRYRRSEDLGGLEGFGDIFADLFRQGQTPHQGSETRFRMRGADASYSLAVDFIEAATGGKKRVDMPDGKTLDIAIPAGVEDGQTLRLRGQGGDGFGGGPQGDALITITVLPHPTLRREGNTIRSTLAITLHEALAGATVQVETVTGPVNVKVPRHSNSGRVLRLRGKGVQGKTKGDHLVELQVAMPSHPDEELEQFIARWEERHPYNPRKGSGKR